VFSALNKCPFEDVKVVIIGQDPYHGHGQGHGLAFSVQEGVNPPPSLKNIFKELESDVGIDHPSHGNLECWATQGILLLNTVLTVRRGEANSHSKMGWEDCSDEIVEALNEKRDGLVFLLWGAPAAKKGKTLDASKHTVIKTSHPSPLGATKTKTPFLVRLRYHLLSYQWHHF
jgi:uracil-DNA glycosylase